MNRNIMEDSRENIKKGSEWRVCRLCMSQTRLSHLFTSDDRSLFFKLTACLIVQVQDGDGFPPFVCDSCETKLCSFYDFKKQCEETAMKLKETIASGYRVVETYPEKCEESSTHNEVISEFLSDIDEVNNELNETDESGVLQLKIVSNKRKSKNLKGDIMTKKRKFNSKHEKLRNIINKEQKALNKSVKNENIEVLQTSNNILDNDNSQCKKFQCELCGDIFKWKSVLNKHLITHSSDKAKYGCRLCSKHFTRKEYVDVHMRIHAGVRPFICEICAHSFVKIQDLIRHKSIHSDEKKFSCPECNKKFKRSVDVHAHVRTHTGIVPYNCKRCSKGYKSRTGMIKHYNKNQCSATSVDDTVNNIYFDKNKRS